MRGSWHLDQGLNSAINQVCIYQSQKATSCPVTVCLQALATLPSQCGTTLVPKWPSNCATSQNFHDYGVDVTFKDRVNNVIAKCDVRTLFTLAVLRVATKMEDQILENRRIPIPQPPSFSLLRHFYLFASFHF